ncbi:HEAT repeat domain-containing protein [Agriterribacter sp.]|uniref:HEAT repeat domain-containing protein n=1 Tax=Agriterribacter sp. TaxID=2821509 RepID=UPI002CEC7D15|nr:HEAT repeat domain-containing protein [Agriterribacter sp.]HRO47297.1 HEAT repeat domain-containing protein [Agriterribacter sp.]HRQ16539.1 HEAT repeat domain-containing protein [Agriterribacter sp.]
MTRKQICTYCLPVFFIVVFCAACRQPDKPVAIIKQMDSAVVASFAASIEAMVKPELAEGLTLRLWGTDSLVISPVAIQVDNDGTLYYTTTDRQKNSEFDIRGHREWEIPSISFQTVEDRRAFLRSELSPENSKRNEWLADLNKDSSHDWRDLTVEKELIYKMQDTNGDGIADKTQLIVDDFHDEVTDVAGSVFKHDNDLYVAVAPDLWKLKDKDGDGIPDEKVSLSHGYGVHIGFGGHGMSGIEMGPDGRIYWQIGDIGFNGKGTDGQVWAYPNSGVIARCNPDGSDFEIFAAGLRNTHEFAFDEYGNLISEDNDGDHPGEKERLVYIVNGSDAGWRSNWQYGKYRDPKNNTYKVWMEEKMHLPRFEGQAAYIIPCISNFVSGPSGFVYNPGTALSAQYKNSFFVSEFVGNPGNSAVHNFKLNPKGAGFELGETKKILSGVLVTGLDFGPDGSLYLADWIDGWDTHDYGRIWRLDAPQGAGSPERIETKKLLSENFTGKSEEELAAILEKPDMRVRQKAQFELVKRGGDGAAIFQKTFSISGNQLARINAIWGMSQLARKDKKYAVPLLSLLQDKDPEIRAQAAKWLGDMKYEAAGEKLLPLLKDTASRVRFFAAEALGRIKYAPAINAVITMLEENNDEDVYLRHAGCLALARIGKADPVVALAQNPSRALRIAAVVTLRRMGNAGIAKFLNDKDEFVVTEAARAINDDNSIKDALPALGDLLGSTHFTNEALIRRIINANLRTGSGKAMQQLIAYTLKEGAPAKMRAEAIDALSVWAKPSVLDRVDGYYRGGVERDSVMLQKNMAVPLVQLVKDKELVVRLSAAKAVKLLNTGEALPLLFTLVKNDPAPDMRVEALNTLVALGNSRAGEAVSQALADKEKNVRVAGLHLLQQMDLPKGLMVSLLSKVIADKTMEEKQAAILALGKLPKENAQKPIEALLLTMAAGKLSPDLYLELGEAIDSIGVTDLKTKYKTITQKFSPDEQIASYAGSLYGGDITKGRAVFFRNQNAQCMRCHSYDDRGGNAGPRLNGIAGRISRQQLLESLINPGARLAPGYGIVSLELKNGTSLSGILEAEDKTSLTLKMGGEPLRVIKKDQIAKRTNAPSSMPDMKLILSKKEIRDVVSFLATMKEDH